MVAFHWNVKKRHRKKQTLKKYPPLSVLPICGKIFKCLLYDTLLSFFCMNNLRSTNQSGFRPKDSCISQLQSILSAFDMGLEVCGIFLAIYKAFDKV